MNFLNTIFNKHETTGKVIVDQIELADLRGQVAAISKSQAVIEFNLDGTIITANENFLSALGYRLDEVQGRHHSMFVEPATRDSQEYRLFWEDLRSGAFQAAQYKRITKAGKEITCAGQEIRLAIPEIGLAPKEIASE